MKKNIWFFVFGLLLPTSASAANRWIIYSATPTINCSSFLNGGKLVQNGADAYCADDAGISTATLVGYLTATSTLSATNLTSGTVPNARIDSSSVTLRGNTFNGSNQLLLLNGSGVIPALSGANLTSLPAANLTGTVPNASIDTSSITKLGNTFNSASQLLQLSASGLIPNANVDASSVTKQGNTFNGTNQLVQLNGSGQLPALSATNLTALPAANLSGTVPNASLDASSVTKMGSTFNGINQLLQLNGSGAIPALSAANLTSIPAGNLTGTVPNSTLDSSSVTKTGNTFNAANKLLQLDSVGGFNLTQATFTRVVVGNGYLLSTAANRLTLWLGTSAIYTWATDTFFPNTDNTVDLGGSGNRFKTVFPVDIGAVSDNSVAATGRWGETISSNTTNSTSFPSSGSYGDIGLLDLKPGDWMIYATLWYSANGATVTTVELGASSTSGNSSSGLTLAQNRIPVLPPIVGVGSNTGQLIYEVNLTAETTYYMKYTATYSAATPIAQAHFWAKRPR